jgi:hypothetical protein
MSAALDLLVMAAEPPAEYGARRHEAPRIERAPYDSREPYSLFRGALRLRGVGVPAPLRSG